mgnify:CR=1 FL=1
MAEPNESTSGEPITPKAQQRVLDGEVSEAAQSQHQAKKDTPGVSRSRGSWWKWTALILLLGVLALAYLNWQQTHQQNRQIERINQLQSQVQQLQQAMQSLETEQSQAQSTLSAAIQAQQEKLAAVLKDPKQQPAVSQEDLQALEKNVARLRDNLQTQLAQAQAAATQAADKASQQAQARVEAFLDSLEGQSLADADIDQVAKQAEAQMREQLQQMQEKLSALFSFKAEQEKAAQAPDSTATSPVSKPLGLTQAQLHQWLVKVNTQWLITGHGAQTRAQLLALEQALAASAYPDKTRLIRILGQDLARLQSQETRSQDQWTSIFAELTEWVNTNVADATQAQTQTDSQDSASSPNDWADQVWTGLSQLFEVRKRDSDPTLTQVEKQIKADVIQQRGWLLIERMRWAVQTRSAPLLAEARAQMLAFGKTYVPEKQSSLARLLAPLEGVTFAPRQPLKIVAEVQ